MSPNAHVVGVGEDKPGVLAQVARRCSPARFQHQVVGSGCHQGGNRSGSWSPPRTSLEQITKQLQQADQRHQIVERGRRHSVSRELALIKVQTDMATVSDRSGESVSRQRD